MAMARWTQGGRWGHSTTLSSRMELWRVKWEGGEGK